MEKTKLIPLALAVFLLANLTVATADASRPKAMDFATTVDTYLSVYEGDYLPGTPVPLGRSRFYRLIDRYTVFNLAIPGLGDCTFTLTEDAIINSVSNTGITYGDITVASPYGVTLTAKSIGRLFPQLVELGNGQFAPAVGFSGRVHTVGKGNAVNVVGEYVGYFMPDNPNMLSGYLHMEMTLKIY